MRICFGSGPAEVSYLGTDTREHGTSSSTRLDPIRLGLEAGADGFEVDIRPFHEGKKMLTGKHPLLEEELLSLKQLFESLPPDRHVYLEVKNRKVFLGSKRKLFERQLADFIRANDLYDRVTLVGFALVSLWRIKRLDARIDVEAGVTHPRFQDVTHQLVDRAHRMGVRVAPWVCEQTRREEKGLLQRFIEWGVDAVYTNSPDTARKIQKEGKQPGW